MFGNFFWEGVIMKRSIPCLSVLVFAAGVYLGNAAEQPAAKSQAFATEKDKVSYVIGRQIGTNLKNQSIDINPDVMAIGVSEVFSGKPSSLTDAESQDVMKSFQQDIAAKQAAKKKLEADKNKKEGDDFLAKNKKVKGVKVMPSGLQYKVIVNGKGEKPAATDTVVVNYRGTLINGKEFDSSYKRGTPATFPVNGVIKGWTEALQLMKTGSKWELYIPSDLAYGERGAGADIGPNETLVFSVELMSIQKAK